MKKFLLTASLGLLVFLSQAQTRFGFAAAKQGYDNFNVNDPSAAIELVVFTENNDTLMVATGANISPIDGTARNGVDFNFTAQLWRFPIGTTIYNGSNRKKLALNLVPNTTFYGQRQFYLKLTGLQGVTVSDLLYQLDLLTVHIDYDGTNVGIAKVSVHDYKLYPIPATIQLFIEGVNSTDFKVYDLTGRLVKSGEVMQNSIDVSDLSNGLYVLHALSDKGLIVQKFIKE